MNNKINNTGNLGFKQLLVSLFGLLITALILLSCIDEYMPALNDKYQELLVVDGEITNEPPPYFIRLSFSSNTERPEKRPVSGYQVILSDNVGNSSVLYDMGDGRYKSPANGIQGIPGRSYKLQITSPQGNNYESGFEKMHEPVGIDTVYAEYEVQENINYNFDLEGYRFYISTRPSALDTTYFLWDLEGTYKYKANHSIKYVFDGQLSPFSQYDSLRTCWHTYKVPEIHTHHTLNVSEPFLVGYPLHFVNTLDKKLSIRYSLLTRQMVVSSDAYVYWKTLKDQTEETGSLYAKQPFQIRGNVNNIQDPDIPVLGHFTVGSITEKRIFVDRPTYANFHYPTQCYLITEDLFELLWLYIDQWPLYLTAEYGETGGQSPALPANQECVDCTKSGGTIVQPDYWTNK